MTMFNRYREGDHIGVWIEIRSQSNQDCWDNPDIIDVARETMDRVAKNADHIAARLRSAGWKALSGEFIDLRTSPLPGDEEIINLVEETTGSPLPLSLAMFWRHVGGINWVWDYERSDPRPSLGLLLPLDEFDPLCVYPPEAAAYSVDEWMDEDYSDNYGLPAGQFQLDLAPDDLHKANISGGDPYGIRLPCNTPDPVFDCGSQSAPFVDYLRRCFKWAGFPGLEEHAGQPNVDAFLKEFGDGIVPF